MKTKSSKVKFFAVCILLIAVFVTAPTSATDSTELTPVLPTPVPELRSDEIPVDSYRPGMVDDASAYIEAVNDELGLNLSPEEIDQYAVTLASRYLSASEKISPTSSIRVNNYSEFQQDIVDILGLNEKKSKTYFQLSSDSESFCATEEVMQIIRQETFASRDNSYVAPSSQSAPYAYGKLAYVYIFVNFQGNPDATWTNSERTTASNNAQLGAAVIKNRAPAAANIENSFGCYTTTVSGVDYGSDSPSTWGSDGWMEEAASNLGFNSPEYDRSTEYMADYLMDYYDADSVILVYCIYDNGRSYAIGPGTGYADKCVVYSWSDQKFTYRGQAEKNVYAHETLHLYGAYDEYPGVSSHNGISTMAVSPLREWYRNTNHHTSPNHQHSIMCDVGIDANNPVISQSSKNFIGWGDYDGDGNMDALEIRAGTA